MSEYETFGLLPAGALTVAGGIVLAPPRPQFLTIGSGAISINMETLEVTLKDGLPLDEASRRFWNAVLSVVGKPPPFPEVT